MNLKDTPRLFQARVGVANLNFLVVEKIQQNGHPDIKLISLFDSQGHLDTWVLECPRFRVLTFDAQYAGTVFLPCYSIRFDSGFTIERIKELDTLSESPIPNLDLIAAIKAKQPKLAKRKDVLRELKELIH